MVTGTTVFFRLVTKISHVILTSRLRYIKGLQSEVDSLKQLQAETTTELDALLPSVLDRAFKGEL